MKKLIALLSILGVATVYAVAPLSSPQIGTSPTGGYILQTNGTTSTWVATSSLGISGGSVAGSNGQVQFNNGGILGAAATFLWDNTIGRLLVGSGASTTTYPSAKAIFADNSSSDVEIHNIGVVGSAVASSTDVNTWGVGGYFKGWTNSGTRSGGVIGEGMVTNTGDTGSSIGVRGYANQTHAGGLNIGLLGDAQNSSTGNYALYMNAGNIFSNIVQSWTLPSNTSALTIGSSTGNPAMSFDTANSRVQIGSSQAPTHSLTLDASSTGIAIYNTKDQVTNYERGFLNWSGNTFRVETQKGGTGAARSIAITTPAGSTFLTRDTGTTAFFNFTRGDVTSNVVTLKVDGTETQTSGNTIGISIAKTINQPATSSANYTALQILPIETSVSTSTRSFLISAGTSTNPSMFTVNNLGNVGIGTSSPAEKLHTYVSSGSVRNIIQSGTVIGQFLASDATGRAYVGSRSNSPFTFRVNDTDKMTLDTTGFLGIGTTSPNASLWVTGSTGSSIFTVASSSNVSIFSITSSGDIQTASSTATTPTLSACGTSPSFPVPSNDTAGTVTEGSVATGCTITFSTVKARIPHCVVTSQSGLTFSYTTTASALTITNIGALSSTNIDYHCIQ